jgi:hypothetical protein
MVEERAFLPELRERIRRLERPAEAIHGVLPFGIAAIDRSLPGGGLARGALHEILGAGGDEEDGALAAAFIAHILGQFTDSSTSQFALSARLRGEREGSPRRGGGEGVVGGATARPRRGRRPPPPPPPPGGGGGGGLFDPRGRVKTHANK